MNDDYRTPQDAPEVISTSQAVNLTSTIASLSALFALFFCFADQRSRAVRRLSVQSVGLGAIHLLLGMVIWILCEILGWIPLVGSVLRGLLLLVLIVATVIVIILRVRMALHAYRGEAHVLPVIGQALRRFE